jgi:hypothetical protein
MTIEDLIETIAPSWFKKTGATTEQIKQAEAALGVGFPSDYKTFLSWSNGGEGQIGNRYFSFWSAEEIKELNDDYQISKYLPGSVGIGTDGGGECYALDYRMYPETPSLIQCPLGDLDFSSIVVLGSTFRDGIEGAMSSK